jgi:hypothetical protein
VFITNCQPPIYPSVSHFYIHLLAAFFQPNVTEPLFSFLLSAVSFIFRNINLLADFLAITFLAICQPLFQPSVSQMRATSLAICQPLFQSDARPFLYLCNSRFFIYLLGAYKAICQPLCHPSTSRY